MLASAPQGWPRVEQPAASLAHQVGGLDRGVGAGRSGTGRPGSRRSAGRTPRARWRSSTARSTNQRPSPMHSAAIRIRSAFSRRGCSGSPCPPRRPGPSAGTRGRRRTPRSVAWLIIVSIGRIVRPLPRPRACRPGTRTGRGALGSTRSSGVVRASTSIRSECCAREVNTFWPWTSSRRRRARRWSGCCVVSEPAVGSVTPNACSRSSPDAIFGRYAAFCSSLPCRSSAPMVYIWAWHAAALPPERVDLLEDHAGRGDPEAARRRIARGSARPASRARSARRRTPWDSVGLQPAPVLGGEPVAQLAHRVADGRTPGGLEPAGCHRPALAIVAFTAGHAP